MPKIIKNSITYGSSSPMVELTQAEYNALSSAQKNNGTIYLITDSEPDAFNLNSMDDVNISNPTSGDSLVYDGAGWINSSELGNKIEFITLSASTTITREVNVGTIIFMSRQNIGRHCLYMIDGSGSIETFIESHQDLTLSYSNGVLTIENPQTSGRYITLIKT